MPSSIFRLHVSLERSRPEIDFLRIDPNLNWDVVLAGDGTTSLHVRPALRPGRVWDYFACPGTLGAGSERLSRYIEAHACGTVILRPVAIEGDPYYILVVGTPKDWFDRERALVDLFAGSDRIKWIRQYAFRVEVPSDAVIFTVTDSPSELFATEAAVREMDEMGVRGLGYTTVFTR